MLKMTPLNQTHRDMNAKMVDFGGWDMPLHYGSQLDEHHKVRQDAGMFDVSHMLPVDIKGDNVRGFLRQLVANNVDKLTVPGKALYSCMLTPQAGIIDDLIIYFLSETWFRIVVNAGTADKDVAWMLKQRDALAPHLEITPRRDMAMVAVQGPNARAKVWQVIPGSQAVTEELKQFQSAVVGQYFIARTGYTGEDGFEIILPAADAPVFWKALHAAGVAPAGLGARDTLRLEAGMNLYGQDMDETKHPLESGLAWTVDLKSERDFIGKQALLDTAVTHQLVGLVLIDRGVLRSHQEVVGQKDGAEYKGEITSGGFSPTMNQSIALARVPVQIAVGDEVDVIVRDKKLRAKVVKYPFVRNGNVLI
ncbi:glycine cleavage system aminomethyltransferase GcvT [Nitrosomonas oligotropha]|uniref:Aminomethyltransferase n=1 Tax=Nitrosomonas oligotropha TaxID=42354 RepID=A0A1H8SMX2_9PROT|nr:glycine cleavage system aminomethyltransferase GcvT [Nitrosomonas oligotropha]SDX15712.1 aminomethyltransferase [Nitrosomonas oligotropha]SEO79638.1 aminomethyltransferase [Nitrosomonas oligotropha]